MRTNILSVVGSDKCAEVLGYWKKFEGGSDNNPEMPSGAVTLWIEMTFDYGTRIPLFGLITAIEQFVWGFFETLLGAITLDKTLAHRGVTNLWRGALEMIPIAGYWIVKTIDEKPFEDAKQMVLEVQEILGQKALEAIAPYNDENNEFKLNYNYILSNYEKLIEIVMNKA